MSSENVFTFYENLKETLEKLGSQGGGAGLSLIDPPP